MNALGDTVTRLLRGAHESVRIVAPFIGVGALERLFGAIREDVRVAVATRWHPSEIIAGVSDLEVYDLVQHRNAELFLRQDLHAKFFAADDEYLVGSANVTGSGLGWNKPANLELLVNVHQTDEMVQFEGALFAGSVLATAGHLDLLRRIVELECSQRTAAKGVDICDTSTPTLLPSNWIPRTMNPEELFSVYLGEESSVSQTALKAMRAELTELGIPSGLDKDEFHAWIAAIISLTPLVSSVVTRIDSDSEITEKVLNDLLIELDISVPGHDVLRALERWLTCFFETRYETVQDSIKLVRARTI